MGSEEAQDFLGDSEETSASGVEGGHKRRVKYQALHIERETIAEHIHGDTEQATRMWKWVSREKRWLMQL